MSLAINGGTVERLHTMDHFIANAVSADCHFNIRWTMVPHGNLVAHPPQTESPDGIHIAQILGNLDIGADV